MTLDPVQLQRHLLNKYPDVERVSPSAFMFTRRAGDIPFAMIYLDLADRLPCSRKELSDYQSQLVGERYFSGRQSLQWSQYLYFVTSRAELESPKGMQAKRLIEEDTEYARKFVIAEEDVDSVLGQEAILAPRPISTNIMSRWAERLTAVGLDEAVLGEMSLPARLERVETSTGRQQGHSATPTAVPSCEGRFLSSLHLERYRSYPWERDFEFGTVNLICGANATGKTSLLEAVELFYCGKNRRNPKVAQQYSLEVKFSDGSRESVDQGRRLQELRDRNLAWYGQMEVNKTDLFASFGQFNFLDTDAAVGLAEAKADIAEQLSKLLVGPEASRVWRNIESLSDKLAEELRAFCRAHDERRKELEIAVADLRAVGDVPHESDAILGGLRDVLARHAWAHRNESAEQLSSRLLGELPEVVAVASQAADLHWVGAPVTFEALAEYCRMGALRLKIAEGKRDEIFRLQTAYTETTVELERCQEALALAQEAARLLASDVVSRNEARTAARQEIAALAVRLAGAEEAMAARSTPVVHEVTVAEWVQESAVLRDRAQAAAAQTQAEWKRLTNLRDRSLEIFDQLRRLGRQILKDNPGLEQCPLCHTSMGPDELVRRMDADSIASLGAAAAALSTEVERRTEIAAEAEAGARSAAWFGRFCAAEGTSVPVAAAMASVESARRRLKALQEERLTLDEESRILESQGITMARFSEVEARLGVLGCPLRGRAREDADFLTAALQASSERLTADAQVKGQAVGEMKRELLSAFSGRGDASSNADEILIVEAERIAMANAAMERLSRHTPSCPWPMDASLAELAREAESIREIAAQLNSALGREKQVTGLRNSLSNRIDELGRLLQNPDGKFIRFDEAHEALERLRREESLSGAMESTLEELRCSVGEIFARIHSPVEFRGLGAEWTSLLRIGDGSEARLSQISTGQRSAFALAIFLAQNAQLTVAPPVLLIDDPIAHTDDLNALAFLDYLREIALTGKRQIFFATASRKLASLFEKKFDFLGSKFQRLVLEREARNPVAL